MRTWPALDVSRMAPATAAHASAAKPSDLLLAALLDFPVAAIEEAAPDRWRVFFQDAAARDDAAAALRTAFPQLVFDPLDMPDEEWAAQSQADLRAVTAGSIVVAPPWDVPPPGPTVIVIQPSMGFGTGHHATTRLCLVALQRLEVRGRTVIDIGTGSGVLAIAASLLGGADVVGIDDDPYAIEAAQENLDLNPGASLLLRVDDVATAHLVPSAIVLANLTGGLLQAASRRLQELTAAGGRLVISGFQTHEERDVRAAFAAMRVDDRAEDESWVCLTLAAESPRVQEGAST